MSTDGNKVAAALYNEHRSALKRYALRVAPKSDADDLVQETYVRTLKHLSNGNSVKSPRRFLFRILTNLVYAMFRRSEFRYATNSTPDMDEFEADEYRCSPEHGVLAQQQLDAFTVVVTQLPDSYRQCFVLRRVYGVSCKEIAETLGVSEKVVQVRAARGLRYLQDYCQKHGIELEDYVDE